MVINGVIGQIIKDKHDQTKLIQGLENLTVKAYC